jgi:iron(III) transport system substrate-binding protein
MFVSKSKLAAGLGVTAVGVAVSVGVSAGSPTHQAKRVAVAAKNSQLVIYGNPPPAQFNVVLNAFQKANPSIKVRYSDQEDNVSFSKYRAEHAQHARTADLIIASSPMNWNNNRNIALRFTPKGAGSFPRFLTQFPGVFVLSPDPAVSVYNKARVKRVPHNFAQLETALKNSPGIYKNKIATFSVDNQFGYTAFWGMVQKHGWGALNQLGPVSKPQPDGTAIIKQIITGASNYGYFMSGLVRTSVTGGLEKIVGWTYMTDFTPLVPRGVAITKGAANPAAAKTFLNWVYSPRGQQTMCAAGFTAFRRGVNCRNSLASVTRAAGGARSTFLIPFNGSIARDHRAFVTRWHRSFH